jgi:hypothetical protein
MFNQNSFTSMEKYMFLFKGGEASTLSPDMQQAQMQKWFAWIEKLRKDDRYVAGEPLLPGGKVVAGVKKTVTDGPFAESKEIIGGFFIVNARNLEEATTMAKDAPDYEIGGSVEVREVMKMDM